MLEDLLVREIIERDRVSVGTAIRQGNIGRERRLQRMRQIPRREQIHAFPSAGPPRMRITPQLVPPVHDVVVRAQAGAQLHAHRRAERLPHELVVAHPLHSDRPAWERAGEQRGIERDVVCAVVAIASGTFQVDADDARGCQPKSACNVAAQSKHALTVSPDRQLAVHAVRHGARRTDRGVQLKRPGVARLDLPHGSRRA